MTHRSHVERCAAPCAERVERIVRLSSGSATAAALALALAAGLALAAASSLAQGATQGAQPMAGSPQSGDARTDRRAGPLSISHPDRRFVTQAHADGLAEIELGKMATQRAATPAARRFGEQMVREHTAANTQLATIAKRKTIVLQERPSPRNRLVAERLERQSNEDFDRAYLRGQVQDHEAVISRFEVQVRSGRDRDIKAFAEQTLPKLREHVQMAREAERQVVTAKVSSPAR